MGFLRELSGGQGGSSILVGSEPFHNIGRVRDDGRRWQVSKAAAPQAHTGRPRVGAMSPIAVGAREYQRSPLPSFIAGGLGEAERGSDNHSGRRLTDPCCSTCLGSYLHSACMSELSSFVVSRQGRREEAANSRQEGAVLS